MIEEIAAGIPGSKGGANLTSDEAMMASHLLGRTRIRPPMRILVHLGLSLAAVAHANARLAICPGFATSPAVFGAGGSPRGLICRGKRGSSFARGRISVHILMAERVRVGDGQSRQPPDESSGGRIGGFRKTVGAVRQDWAASGRPGEEAARGGRDARQDKGWDGRVTGNRRGTVHPNTAAVLGKTVPPPLDRQQRGRGDEGQQQQGRGARAEPSPPKAEENPAPRPQSTKTSAGSGKKIAPAASPATKALAATKGGDGTGEFVWSASSEQQLFAAFGDKISKSLEDLLVYEDEDEDEGASEPSKGKQAAKRREADGSTGAAGQEGPLSTEQILSFERNGHIRIGGLVKGDTLAMLRGAVDGEFERRSLEAYTQKLRVFGVPSSEIAQCETKQKAKAMLLRVCEREGFEVPFLQIFNVHRGSNEDAGVIRSIATSEEFGRMAADLLGVDAVMLYQTAAFYKEAGHGETAWHSDLNTAPFDTNDMVTFWLALTDVPDRHHSPLEFASRSQKDFALPYWYTNEGMENLEARGYAIVDHSPLSPGDCTAHHGWLLHSAPPNESEIDRKAIAVSFIGVGAKRLPVKGRRREPDDEDMESYKGWFAEIGPGQPAKHKLMPVVYDRKTAKKTKRV